VASSSLRLAAVLAHQGGWDEMLLVAVPIVVIFGLLAVAKRRVESAAAKTAEQLDGPGHVGDGR
jgi:hypothetical protein